MPRGVPSSWAAPVVLSVRGLSAGRLVRDVSFELRRGEVVGFAGLRGSGRTELAALLSGVARADGGELKIDGVRVRLDSPRQALAR